MILVTIFTFFLLQLIQVSIQYPFFPPRKNPPPSIFSTKFEIDGPSSDDLGEKALSDIVRDKVFSVADGPFFTTEPSGPIAELVKSFSFHNFSLITSGKTLVNGSEFWLEKEEYTANGTVQAERVTGVVGLVFELFEGLAQIQTTKSEGPKLCQVIGSTREYSPVGRDYDYIGNPALKILFQSTVVKKPFAYVVNDYMLDASTRPVYRLFNETVAQAFHFDYHIDPNCDLGLNRTELGRTERFIDYLMEKELRGLMMDRLIREGYQKDALVTYGTAIGAKMDEEKPTNSSGSDDYWKKSTYDLLLTGGCC